MLEIANSKDLLQSEIISKQKGLLHVLTELFPSCSPPLEAFLQLSQKIMPRYYTIASSSVFDPTKIRIAISLTEDEKFTGLTSQFLKNVHDKREDGMCNIFVKDSMFEMPKSYDTPMIMVGPGTGVVPFIGFLEEIWLKRLHK